MIKDYPPMYDVVNLNGVKEVLDPRGVLDYVLHHHMLPSSVLPGDLMRIALEYGNPSECGWIVNSFSSSNQGENDSCGVNSQLVRQLVAKSDWYYKMTFLTSRRHVIDLDFGIDLLKEIKSKYHESHVSDVFLNSRKKDMSVEQYMSLVGDQF